MIIVKLKGGLGNQMFQYAFGKALSLKLKQRLFFDNTFLSTKINTSANTTTREFELSLFPHIHLKLLPTLINSFIYSNSPVIIKLINRTRLTNKICQLENEYLKIDNLQFMAINIFEGYFQSQNYFRNCLNIIRSDFIFPALDTRNNSVKDQIVNSNSVAIHIRRGDYSSNLSTMQYHGILPLEYYNKSIALLEVAQLDLKYFIFTDDVLWAKEKFKPEYPKIIIVEGNNGADSWKDMALMTYAKHHIVSNSSFSWWGAWLAVNKGMKIAPGRWFNPEVANFDIQTIIPGNWTIVY